MRLDGRWQWGNDGDSANRKLFIDNGIGIAEYVGVAIEIFEVICYQAVCIGGEPKLISRTNLP